MNIKYMDLKQNAIGEARLTIVLDVPPSELSDAYNKIREGKAYECIIRQKRKSKTLDQVGAAWGKIGEIADAISSSKDEVYEEMLRRYGQSIAMRIPSAAVEDLRNTFRLVDVKQEREDGTAFVIAYRGLSQMDTKEASAFLEGILQECVDIGISREIRK